MEDLCDNVKSLCCTDTMFLYNQYGHQMHEAECFELQVSWLCITVCKGLDKVIYDFL